MAGLLLLQCLSFSPAPETPETPNGPGVGVPGPTYSFSTRTSGEGEDSVQFQFGWGDGTTSDWGDYVPSGLMGWAGKSWPDTGTYLVRVWARNSRGAVSDTSGEHSISITAELPNQPPYPPEVPTGPDTAARREVCVFASAGTDPDGDSIAYCFDCGGLQSNWSALVPSGTPGSISFAWAHSGEYEVRARTRDRGGLSSGWSFGHRVVIR
jgi:hypothetical protein